MSIELTPAMRRSMLIAALRDRALWPEGFAWNFGSCRTCAMGLYAELVGVGTPDFMHIEARIRRVAEPLGLTVDQAKEIFMRGYAMPEDSITPEMVAARLEAVHKELAL